MMSIKKTPVKFKTTDGSEFDTEAKAETHEALYQANEEYQSARRKLGRLLAETQITADGEQFQFGVYRDYHRIVPNYWGWPSLDRVPYLGWNWRWDNAGDRFVIHVEEYLNGVNQNRSYAIGDLYASERKAREALIAAREERLGEFQAELAELKAKK